MVTIAIGALVLVLDYVTKWLVLTRMELHEHIPIIPGFLDLTYVMNPGAAFGILAHQKWLFVTVSLLAVGLIAYFAFRPEGRQPLIPIAMGLILGGAVGNLIDRIRFSAVVDMLLLYYKEWSGRSSMWLIWPLWPCGPLFCAC